jgi:hypothetical protein
LDHRGVVFRLAFVVADGASATVDPGAGALHGPAAVQDDEAGLVGEFADEDRHQQSGGGDDDVAFTSVDLLAGVVTAAGTPDGLRRAEGLGVDQAGGRDGLAAFGDANLFTQGVMDPGQGAVGGPDGEVVGDELRVREVARQGPPDAAVVGDVADRSDDVPPGLPHESTASGRARTADPDQARDQVPFGVAGVPRVDPSPGGR